MCIYIFVFISFIFLSDLVGARSPLGQTLVELMTNLKASVQAKVNKNVEILQLSSQICRRMRGLRFTSCKSAKDRTGMSVTLEQVNILTAEYHLAEHEYIRALDCMRRLIFIKNNVYICLRACVIYVLYIIYTINIIVLKIYSNSSKY